MLGMDGRQVAGVDLVMDDRIRVLNLRYEGKWDKLCLCEVKAFGVGGQVV